MHAFACVLANMCSVVASILRACLYLSVDRPSPCCRGFEREHMPYVSQLPHPASCLLHLGNDRVMHVLHSGIRHVSQVMV